LGQQGFQFRVRQNALGGIRAFEERAFGGQGDGRGFEFERTDFTARYSGKYQKKIIRLFAKSLVNGL